MRKKFIPLFITNFWGVLNDNFLKAVTSFVAVKWVDTENVSLLISSVAAALVLPYVILSPLAGKWAQKYDKRDIVFWAKVAELPIMTFAAVGFMMQSTLFVLLAILLMGIQSALYSPAKYGLIRDIGGDKGISFGTGGMEAISFLGILSGMLIAAFLVDDIQLNYLYMLFILFAALGLLCAFTIKRAPSSTTEVEFRSSNPIKALRETYFQARKFKGLNNVIFILSIFWWLAASLQIGLLIYCGQTMQLSSWYTGVILSMAAVGITLGCFLSGLFYGKKDNLSSVFVSGLIITALLLVIFFVELSPIIFGTVIFGISVVSGFFKVPLDAAVQRMAKGNFLPIALGYLNQVSFIFILFSSLSISLLTLYFDPKYMFLMFGIVIFGVVGAMVLKVPTKLMAVARFILSSRYKIKVKGEEIIDQSKSTLVLPNHVSLVDPVIVYSQLRGVLPRPFVTQGYVDIPILGTLVKSFDAIAVPDMERGRKGIEQVQMLEHLAVEALVNGTDILIYPSGRLTVDGRENIGNSQLVYNISDKLPKSVQVLAVKIDGLWGSRFSRYGRKSTPPFFPVFMSALPRWFFPFNRREVTVTIIDITKEVNEWSKLNRREFNAELERIYAN